MVNSGICCANLKDNRALMKMGLTLVLVGHVNFLLGALVHGVVLRYFIVKIKVRTLIFAVFNVTAIVEGLIGIISGIVAIVLSKNKKNKTLMWVMLVFSFLAGFLGISAALGLSYSLVRAIILRKERVLKNFCKFFDEAPDPATITNECPFDPTRIYATSIILWMPLIVMCIVESVFTFRCFAACTSFLYLCPCRKKPVQARRVKVKYRDEIPMPFPEEGAEEPPAEQDDLLHGSNMLNDWV
ncbi:PREDICTED: transmembrane protein 54-like [Poecilia mexicana]|uniref:Transmembrane protein 54a n=1 Tax=Poecilia mexicana TaxID=48701 RepID=A0A3B3YY76_9TELE|nr:PREDICTED: transmembrane protein 54-like [Poecilia mexicana]